MLKYAGANRKALTKRQRLNMLNAQLENERTSFLPHWRELSEYILPRRSRFFLADVNRGDKRNHKIIDSTATYAARTLRAGLMSGVTSPARDWFRLLTQFDELNERGDVKKWLHTVEKLMRTVFIRSNLYNVLPIAYSEIGTFATSAIFMEAHSTEVVRFTSIPLGSYRLATDAYGRVNKFFRDYRMTVAQIVEKFGRSDPASEIDWTNISQHVRNLYESNQDEAWIDITHAIVPNEDYDPNKLEAKYKLFSSCYYERGSSSNQKNAYLQPEYDKFLRESGYDFFPVLAPRWEVTGEDTYGTMCPGMAALGDIKMLQVGEKRAMQAVEKMVNPPMVGPSALQNKKASILPGDITLLDIQSGQQGFQPAHEVDPKIQELEHKQQQTRERIRKAFYEDLFLMMAESDRRQITATEVMERREEKLLALGPVLEQLNQDLLDPLIDNTFQIMMSQGEIPAPPQDLQGQDLRVEYISIMHQAQKLAGLSAIERFAGFASNLMQISPEIGDKVNWDEMIDVYGDITSIVPDIIRSDEEVEQIRRQRQQAQMRQIQAQEAKDGAQAIKSLSETEVDPNSALGRLVSRSQAGSIV